MKRNSLRSLFLLQVVFLFIGSPPLFAQMRPLAPTAAEIDQSVTSALANLYNENDAARALGAKAKGVLVFPEIRKGAFIVGAQYGYGALRKGGITAGYYRTGAGQHADQGRQLGYSARRKP
jgi:lipid-binding SYLF domain-containing protein